MLDVACLLVFAGIGRASHEEGLTVGGVLWTLWPFLLGAAFAWSGLTLSGYAHGPESGQGRHPERPRRGAGQEGTGLDPSPARAWSDRSPAGAWSHLSSPRAGVVVWVATVGVGMLARRVVHEGIAPAFVIVAMVFGGVTLIGWRVVATWLGSPARSRATAQ